MVMIKQKKKSIDFQKIIQHPQFMVHINSLKRWYSCHPE